MGNECYDGLVAWRQSSDGRKYYVRHLVGIVFYDGNNKIWQEVEDYRGQWELGTAGETSYVPSNSRNVGHLMSLLKGVGPYDAVTEKALCDALREEGLVE